MASVKKAKSGKTAKKISRGATGLSRLELPPTLKAYQQRVQKQLALLEKEIDRAQTEARRQAARLLRNASRELGRLEAHGEQGWRKLAGDAQKQALRLLAQLEKAIEPAARRKKPARAAKKATKRSAPSPKPSSSAVKQAAQKAASAGPTS
jgi:hypothetical protein